MELFIAMNLLMKQVNITSNFNKWIKHIFIVNLSLIG